MKTPVTVFGKKFANPNKMKTKHMNIQDLDYVRCVLAERVASSVADGDLEPPAGARCRTRSGFRAWLKRAASEMEAALARLDIQPNTGNRNFLKTPFGLNTPTHPTK